MAEEEGNEERWKKKQRARLEVGDNIRTIPGRNAVVFSTVRISGWFMASVIQAAARTEGRMARERYS